MMQLEVQTKTFHFPFADIPSFKYTRKENVPLLSVTMTVHGDAIQELIDLIAQLQRAGTPEILVGVARRESGNLYDVITGEFLAEVAPLSTGEQVALPEADPE